ncbi:MAG: hypothetical protein NC340_02430 [Ruminococcus flavefaciens]|nr:hypothetical protein [Ruminococcus flavefaciens]MCM1229330.1 hypothetical protein [Ruminococcus flavefaciens]
MFYVIAGILLVYPLVITGLNIANFFRKEKLPEIFFDAFCSVIGLAMTFFACNIFDTITTTDYNEAVYVYELHSVLHSEYGKTIVVVITLGYIGLTVLGIFKPGKLPPLVSATSTACTVLGLVAGLFVYIQLANNFNPLHLYCQLYFANMILLAIRRIRYHITEHVRLANERETAYRSRFGAWLGKVMSKVSTMTLFSFALIFPIAVVLEILFILFGQGPDGFIKAFTMTADWTFSTQTPPPPLEYDGHYLCTVSAGGHRKVVKPLRYGKRLGHYIVVNRQLLTANAFEDLLAEKMPKFHRAVRGFYNRYGYPISRHITTQFRADIVYILMKPLEYIFVFVLYLCDSHPENRIAVQYSDYKRRDLNA